MTFNCGFRLNLKLLSKPDWRKLVNFLIYFVINFTVSPKQQFAKYYLKDTSNIGSLFSTQNEKGILQTEKDF